MNSDQIENLIQKIIVAGGVAIATAGGLTLQSGQAALSAASPFATQAAATATPGSTQSLAAIIIGAVISIGSWYLSHRANATPAAAPVKPPTA